MIWVDFVKQGFICKWRRIGPEQTKKIQVNLETGFDARGNKG